MRSAPNHTAGGQGKQTCTTADCNRPASWIAYIDDAEPPAWHPYCESCASAMNDVYAVREGVPMNEHWTDHPAITALIRSRDEAEAEVERLREGGKETNAKLDHTLQAYGRLERTNADLRRELDRLRCVLTLIAHGCDNPSESDYPRLSQVEMVSFAWGALSLDASSVPVEAESGSPERPTP